MDNALDRMRKKQAERYGLCPQARPPAEASTPPAAKPKPPRQKKAPKEPPVSVTCSCGCAISVATLAKEPCVRCHDKEGRERLGQQREKARLQERLPDGSVFHEVYDAEAVLWTGTLLVPTPVGTVVFEAQMSGVFALKRKLDEMWRAHEAKVKAEVFPGEIT